ncbi:MAG TPA: glycosyltransferase, partial [Geobacteraceae bacterium]|nr:glycosyltransferase [Geobacteraceae bacterium]
MTFLFWIALITFLLYLVATLDLLRGNRTVQALRNVPPVPGSKPARVSIIVPARNEQRNIREALQSMLELDYPDYELIAVDDRSEDSTGWILDEMAAASPRLKVIHVDRLPHGWLGKNHALWVGSGIATGDLFLFTDADIVMEPTILTRAVAFLEDNRLDHLAATPSMRMPTLFLSMFGASFIIFFSLFARPWKARDSASSCHIGIGAFNLVRGEVYRKVGGHETIRLRPDDDIKLGKIVKKGGFRQDVVYAPEFMAVEWYSSVAEVIKGLEKNAFSGADYNIPLVLFGSLFHIVCSIWPFLALFVTHGVVRVIYSAVVCLIVVSFVDSARFHHAKAWYVIGYPLTTALFVFILLRTMLLNLVQGGI